MTPFFSIIMPAWNVSPYIDDAIQSVYNQSFTDWELIIINDGSTDNTLELANAWCVKDTRIRVINLKKNQGLSVARNTGLAQARGTWVFFMDSDDLIERDTLLDLDGLSRENDKVEMIAFTAQPFSSISEHDISAIDAISDYYSRSYIPEGVYHARDYYKLMKDNHNFVASSCLYFVKKTVYEKYKMHFLKGIIHEDELFTRQLLFKCNTIFFIRRKYYLRRVRTGSITQTKNSVSTVVSYLKISSNLLKICLKKSDDELFKDSVQFYKSGVNMTEAYFSDNLFMKLRLVFTMSFLYYSNKKRIIKLIFNLH